MEEKLKILEETSNLNKLYMFISYYVHLGSFIAMLFRGNIHVWLAYTKTWSPRICTVLHWRPPRVNIFGTDRSLLYRQLLAIFILIERKRMGGGGISLWQWSKRSSDCGYGIGRAREVVMVQDTQSSDLF